MAERNAPVPPVPRKTSGRFFDAALNDEKKIRVILQPDELHLTDGVHLYG